MAASILNTKSLSKEAVTEQIAIDASPDMTDYSATGTTSFEPISSTQFRNWAEGDELYAVFSGNGASRPKTAAGSNKLPPVVPGCDRLSDSCDIRFVGIAMGNYTYKASSTKVSVALSGVHEIRLRLHKEMRRNLKRQWVRIGDTVFIVMPKPPDFDAKTRREIRNAYEEQGTSMSDAMAIPHIRPFHVTKQYLTNDNPSALFMSQAVADCYYEKLQGAPKQQIAEELNGQYRDIVGDRAGNAAKALGDILDQKNFNKNKFVKFLDGILIKCLDANTLAKRKVIALFTTIGILAAHHLGPGADDQKGIKRSVFEAIGGRVRGLASRGTECLYLDTIQRKVGMALNPGKDGGFVDCKIGNF